MYMLYIPCVPGALRGQTSMSDLPGTGVTGWL